MGKEDNAAEFARLGETMRHLETRANETSTNVSDIKSRLDKLDGSVGAVATLVKFVGWGVGIAVGLLGIFGAWWLSESEETSQLRMREIAREIVREEMQLRMAWQQDGSLNADNAVAGRPYSFHWRIRAPFDPGRLISMEAIEVTPLVKVDLTATPDEDGKGCTMTLHGSPEDLEALPEKIDAAVKITVSI